MDKFHAFGVSLAVVAGLAFFVPAHHAHALLISNCEVNISPDSGDRVDASGYAAGSGGSYNPYPYIQISLSVQDAASGGYVSNMGYLSASVSTQATFSDGGAKTVTVE